MRTRCICIVALVGLDTYRRCLELNHGESLSIGMDIIGNPIVGQCTKIASTKEDSGFSGAKSRLRFYPNRHYRTGTISSL
jgi:hypothetical protein